MGKLLKYMCVLLLFIGSMLHLLAQQKPLYSQYMLNNYIMNPAVTGMHEFFEVNSNYRHQWVGMPDGPKTYVLSVHGPHKYKNYGLGGALYSDVTGHTSRTGLSLSYAYHFNVTKAQQIALGLSGGLMQFTVDGTKITLADPGDLVLMNTMMSVVVPDFGFGFNWYQLDKFYFGVSVPQFVQNRLQFFDNATQSLSKLTAHYYINGGYTFYFGDNYSVEPSALIKYGPPLFPQYDLGVRLFFKDILYLGGVFRTDDATSILVGISSPDRRFSLGYAYDLTSSNLQNYTSGTHEISVIARFGQIKPRNKGEKSLGKMERLRKKLEDEKNQENQELENPINMEDTMMLPKQEAKPQEEKILYTIPKSASLEEEVGLLEKREKELRKLVKTLREEAKIDGKSPSDQSFRKRQAYLDTLEEIKNIYLRKQEIDRLLDKN